MNIVVYIVKLFLKMYAVNLFCALIQLEKIIHIYIPVFMLIKW